MIPLTAEQQKSLNKVTHALMLLSICSDSVVTSIISSALDELFGGVLLASEEETAQASDHASQQIKASFELGHAQTGVH